MASRGTMPSPSSDSPVAEATSLTNQCISSDSEGNTRHRSPIESERWSLRWVRRATPSKGSKRMYDSGTRPLVFRASASSPFRSATSQPSGGRRPCMMVSVSPGEMLSSTSVSAEKAAKATAGTPIAPSVSLSVRMTDCSHVSMGPLPSPEATAGSSALSPPPAAPEGGSEGSGSTSTHSPSCSSDRYSAGRRPRRPWIQHSAQPSTGSVGSLHNLCPCSALSSLSPCALNPARIEAHVASRT
eukprot:scaffold155658_cov22-Tisochrysis_lutea.AAC.1